MNAVSVVMSVLKKKDLQMLHKADYKYFTKARQAATISDYTNIHVGCVAVYQGNIIGIGCNCNKTHPSQKYYNRYRSRNHCKRDELLPKLHAEINCINSIKNLDIHFHKVKLYIYRIRRDQPFGLSRPCPSCMAAIRDMGIRDIYYTTNYGYAYERVGSVEGGAA